MGTGRPGVVLVHGFGHGAWCWQYLMPYLDGPALAVDLPGRAGRPAPAEPTFRDYADAVIQDIEAADFDEVILVGHSLAGAMLPLVAHRLHRKTWHMIFIAAPVLMPGEDAFSIFAFPRQQIARAFTRAATRGQPQPRKLPDQLARRQLCNDMNAQQTAFLLSNLVPEHLAITLERASVTVADLPDTPASYVRPLRDATLKPSIQATLAARLGRNVHAIDVDAGHDVMITRPVQLAEIINGIAGRYR